MTITLRTLFLCLAISILLPAQTQYLNGHLNTEGAVNYCGVDTGSSNTYTCTNAIGAMIGSYQIGKTYSFKASHANTGVATLSIDGLSAVTIRKQQGTVDLASVDINNGAVVSVVYDGTYFELQSLPGTPVGAINLAPNTFTVWTSGGLTYYTLQAPAASGYGVTGLTTDVIASGIGNVPASLAVVNPDPGTYGDSTHCINGMQVDAKGRILGVSQTTTCPGSGGSGGGSISLLPGTLTSINPGTLNDMTTTTLSTTISVSGAAVNDSVQIYASSSLPNGIALQGTISSTNTATVQVLNYSGSPYTPGTLALNAQAVHFNTGSGGTAGQLPGSATFDPGAINDLTMPILGTTVSVAGATVGNPVVVPTNATLPAGITLYGDVSSANTVTLRLQNSSGKTYAPGTMVFNVEVWH